MPFFSIIIPSYNRAHLLPGAIDSILQQRFLDYEIIVVDDGSTDNTKEIAEKYIHLKNFKYTNKINGGVCSARNAGAQIAEGEFITFLDSDDRVESDWLNDFFITIKSTEASLVYCGVKMAYDNGDVVFVNPKKPYKNSNSLGFFIAGAWSLKTSIFFDVGMYDEYIRFGENTELRIKLDGLPLKIGLCENYNLIYNVSSLGGGQNQLNKLNGILYTLNKHPAYFDRNPRLKKIQLQTAAIAAARAEMYIDARKIFAQLLKENKTDLKMWVRYLLTYNGFLARLIWKKK